MHEEEVDMYMLVEGNGWLYNGKNFLMISGFGKIYVKEWGPIIC